MATRTRAPTIDLYEEDFFVWSERQAALLRERRFDELDLANLVEEVEDLGGALKRSVLNNARVVIEHLLKLQHSRAVDPRSAWEATVLEHRGRLEVDLTPRLRRMLADELPRIYRIACRNAAAAPRRARRSARNLPLHRRPDHRRMVAVSGRRRAGRRAERW